MNSRLFLMKYCFQYVLLSVVILSLSSPFAFAAQNTGQGQAKPKILVRDFKNFREYVYKNRRILILKNTQRPNIYYSNEKDENISYSQSATKRSYEFLQNGKNLKHSVFYSLKANHKSEVGYYFNKKNVYYKSDKSIDNCSSYKNFLDRLEVLNLNEKIEDSQIFNLLDKNSCETLEPKQAAYFQRIVRNAFRPSKSGLVDCLNKPEVQKVLDQDQFLQTNATAVLARYFNLVDKISKGETPLAIKCELPNKIEGKLAQIDLKSKPPTLAFDLQTITSTTEGKSKYNLSSIVSHELFHYGAQQYPMGQNKDCLDEKFAELFDSICKLEDISQEKVPSSSVIFEVCSGRADQSTQVVASQNMNTKGTAIESGGVSTAATLQDSTVKKDQEQKEKMAQNLASTTNPSDFVPLKDSDVATLANAPLYDRSATPVNRNYGEQQAIMATPEVTGALNRVTSAFDKAANGMSRSLNSAIAMTVNPARADQIRGNVDFSSQNTSVPVAQIVAEKYSPNGVAEQQVLPASVRLADNSAKPAIDAASVAATPATTATAENIGASPTTVSATVSTQAQQQPSAFASNQQAARNPASANGTTETVVLEIRRIVNVKTTASRAPATTTTYDNRALQNLTAFTQMNGEAYGEVTEQYNNPAFEEQLDLRGISISIVDNQKKLIRHMGSKKEVKYNFIDDGKSLIKVENKK